MSARLFTCILPPPEVVEDLDEFVAPRRLEPLRWTHPDTWHLTTSFMGRVAERDLEALDAELALAASATAPFDIRLAGAGCFSSVERTRQLWLGVQAGADELAALATRARNAAVRAGVEVEGGRYVPHLTVARANRPLEGTKWLRVLDAWPGRSWTVTELALIESHMNEPGNRYQVITRLPLVGGQRYPAGETKGTP